MKIEEQEIYLTEKQTSYIKDFFEKTETYLETNDMLNPKTIIEYTNMYEKYLEENNLLKDKLLYYYIVELKIQALKEQYRITELTKKEKLRREAIPNEYEKNYKNPVINKWWKETNIINTKIKK